MYQLIQFQYNEKVKGDTFYVKVHTLILFNKSYNTLMFLLESYVINSEPILFQLFAALEKKITFYNYYFSGSVSRKRNIINDKTTENVEIFSQKQI